LYKENQLHKTNFTEKTIAFLWHLDYVYSIKRDSDLNNSTTNHIKIVSR